jgi:hypothetical protein
VGTIYSGPFAAAIDEDTRYGHEGYAAQVLPGGGEPSSWVAEFRKYRAACGCGWRGLVVHPPTDAGEAAAVDEWDALHLRPLVRGVAARRVVAAMALLDLVEELRRALATAAAGRADGSLTERELGRCEVIKAVEALLDEAAAARSEADR